jgi:hypothetical protein
MFNMDMVDADQLTAFPLKGERLKLKRIDHVLLGILLDEASNDSNSDALKKIGNLYGASTDPNDLRKILRTWFDDFFNRLSADKEVAGFGPPQKVWNR